MFTTHYNLNVTIIYQQMRLQRHRIPGCQTSLYQVLPSTYQYIKTLFLTLLPTSAEVSEWSVMQVCSWLTSLGIVPDIIDNFRANTVTGALIVAGLTDQDLSEMEITSDMVRRSLLASLSQLVSSSSTNAAATITASYNSHYHQQ